MKGRDFYDFVWYASRDVPVNLPHLDARMRQSGYAKPATLTIGELREILANRIRAVDLAAAAEEVRPFLRDARETELWSEEFFLRLWAQVRAEPQ